MLKKVRSVVWYYLRGLGTINVPTSNSSSIIIAALVPGAHVLCPPLHCPKTISLSCCNRHMKHCSIRFHMSPSSRYDVVFFFGLDKQYKILNYYYHYEYLSNFRMCQQALLTSTLCIHSISPLPVPTAHQPSKRSLSRPSKSKSGW